MWSHDFGLQHLMTLTWWSFDNPTQHLSKVPDPVRTFSGRSIPTLWSFSPPLLLCQICISFHPGMSNLQPVGCMQPRMAVNMAQHKIINLLKTLWDFLCVITCHSVCNVWPKTTLLLPVWPRDTKRLDTPAREWVPWGHGSNLLCRFTPRA